MRKIIICILIAIPVCCFAQKEAYKDFYLKNIQVEKKKYDTMEYLDINFLEQDPQINMFGISQFGSYYIENFTDRGIEDSFIKINNPKQLQTAYLQRLEKDSIFNDAMKNYFEKAITKTIPKDTFSYNELLDIAVKFFAITNISEEGKYSGHLCVGINDVATTARRRLPALEAFAFSSIFPNFSNPKYKLSEAFDSNIYKLDDIGMGIDIHEKLLRSQGALFVLMKQDKNLKQLLVDQYELYNSYLPFVLVEKDDAEK